MKTLLISTLIAPLPVVAAPAFAADEINVSNGITAEGAPHALHGADPVTLLYQGEVAEGSADHAVVHDGATYYFASQNRKETFRPPQFPAAAWCVLFLWRVRRAEIRRRPRSIRRAWRQAFPESEYSDALFLEDVTEVKATADEIWTKIEHISLEELTRGRTLEAGPPPHACSPAPISADGHQDV